MWRRVLSIARRFCRQLQELDNQARVVVLVILAIILLVPWLLWWAIWERDSSGQFFGAANSSAFAVLSAFVSFLGVLLATLVLFRLEGIRSTEQFLRDVTDMLDTAQSGNEFVFVAPTFNIQALTNKRLFLAYRRAFVRAVRRGVNVRLSYYKNDVCIDTFMGHDDDRNKKNILLNHHESCDFLKFHLTALDEVNKELESKVDYFTECFGFLQQLRANGLTIECVYVKPTNDGVQTNEHPVFVGNIDTCNYVLGDFIVNPSSPQALRVDVIADHVKAPNSISASTLATLIQNYEGANSQPGRTCLCRKPGFSQS